MAWLFLVLGAVFGVGKGFFGKKASGKALTISHSVKINFIRMLFSVLIGGAFVLVVNGKSAFTINQREFCIALLSGVTLALFTVCWLVLVRDNAYLLVDVFLTCGSIIPVLLSAICFGERAGAKRIFGIVVLTLSAMCMCKYNKRIKGALNIKAIALLVLTGVFHGLNAFCQKWYARTCNAPVTSYNFYTYLTGGLILLLFALLVRGDRQVRLKLSGNEVANVFAIAVCMFLNTLLLTLSAKSLPAYTVYPVKQAISLVLSLVMSTTIFKERLNVTALVGVGLCFVAMVLING